MQKEHEKIENPSAFPLYEVLFAYYDLRKKERRDWNIYAQNKAGAKDLQTLSRALIYLQERNIRSIKRLFEQGFTRNTISAPSMIWLPY